MTSVNTATQVDEGKLNAFIGQMLNDLGGASSIAMVRMGDALGLYKELHTKGPMTSAELASSAKVDPRYCASGCPIRRAPTTCPTTRHRRSSR